MKKSILFLLSICILSGNPVRAQVGKLINKVKSSVTNDVAGKPVKSPDSKKEEPEPKCACEQPELILDLGGTLKLDYEELSISVLDDGSILAKSRVTDEYYIIKDGVTQGPFKSGDPKIAAFETDKSDARDIDGFILRNKPYISKSADKLLITFNGKTYGPYAQINSFTVTFSKEKFAAMVVESTLINADDQKKMEAAIKNAKTDQEKMDLSMQYAQEMQQKMMKAGGPAGTLPKLVTNISNATYDPLKNIGGVLNAKMKYNDIFMIAYDKVIDLQGKTVMTIKPEVAAAPVAFLNTSNTKYVYGDYGTLNFSDGTTMSELFSPHLIKANGQIYLAYMYYSPKRNAIMQCKIPF
jgi:hypothetical protein